MLPTTPGLGQTGVHLVFMFDIHFDISKPGSDDVLKTEALIMTRGRKLEPGCLCYQQLGLFEICRLNNHWQLHRLPAWRAYLCAWGRVHGEASRHQLKSLLVSEAHHDR